MKLSGKKIVLTGASGGIGGAMAKALAVEGCQLLLAGRNTSKLVALMEGLEGVGHSMLVADLNSSEGRSSLLEAVSAFQAEVLINGLGTNQLCLLEATSDSDIEGIIATNLITPIQLCKDFLPLLSNGPNAAIVNIGSILGSIGYAGSSVYCASKFGLRGFTESLRRELADTNIRVIYFAPRATNTELNSAEIQQMNKELGNAVDEPDWVAKMLIETLKDGKSANRYLGRAESFFVRLNSLFPGIVDKALFKQLPIIRRFSSRTN